ncbi:MAG: hypothetical protein GX096_01580 [Clostridiales bacterium]|nr:hypothetical protein [Clostridiales bacterium]
MLYTVLERMIQRGQVSELSDKLDVFFAAGRITEAQYTELVGLLDQND